MISTLPSQGYEALVERCLREVLASASPRDGSVAVKELDARAAPGLCRYLELVTRWGAQIDLTAARSHEELVDLFVADAVVLAAGTERVQDWVDIGTGAGAPGIPLCLLGSVGRMTLVEPRGKRVAFLRTALGALGLTDVQVVRGRAEDVPAGEHEVAVSRATFAPARWLEVGAQLSREHVWVLLAKEAAPALPGWQADVTIDYVWPLTGVGRTAVRFTRG